MKPTKREFHKFIQAHKKHERIKRLLMRQRIIRLCAKTYALRSEFAAFNLTIALAHSPSKFVN